MILCSAHEQTCVSCKQPVRVSWAYRRYTAYVALLVVLLIALTTYSRMSAGPWIIGLVLFWPLVVLVLYAIIPARYECGYPQPQVTLVTTFLGVFVSFFAVEFLGFLSLYVILGARPAEIKEQLFMLSEPLVFFNRQFLISPDQSFLNCFGIMLGNSLLISLPMFLCAKLVQFIFRRNRVIQIGLSNPVDENDV